MVSWAGRLTPDANSRRRCQFGVLAVGGGLCECRYGGARWFLRGPAGQWRLHFEARGQGVDGTLRHPFLIVKVEYGHRAFRQTRSEQLQCHASSGTTMARKVPDGGLRRGATGARTRCWGRAEAVYGLHHRLPARF